MASLGVGHGQCALVAGQHYSCFSAVYTLLHHASHFGHPTAQHASLFWPWVRVAVQTAVGRVAAWLCCILLPGMLGAGACFLGGNAGRWMLQLQGRGCVLWALLTQPPARAPTSACPVWGFGSSLPPTLHVWGDKQLSWCCDTPASTCRTV